MSRRPTIARPDAAIRVMIVEPRPLLGAGVREVFDQASDMEVVAQASSPDEALRDLHEAAPDVILLDVLRPDPTSTETIRRLRQELPNSAVVVLGDGDDGARILAAVTIGAITQVAAIAHPGDLLGLVRRVAHGELPLKNEVPRHPQLTGPILDHIRDMTLTDRPSTEVLTAREMEILRLVARGLRNLEIARQLGVSDQTVKNHLSAIFHKLGVPNRTRAVTYAARQGWLEEL